MYSGASLEVLRVRATLEQRVLRHVAELVGLLDLRELVPALADLGLLDLTHDEVDEHGDADHADRDECELDLADDGRLEAVAHLGADLRFHGGSPFDAPWRRSAGTTAPGAASFGVRSRPPGVRSSSVSPRAPRGCSGGREAACTRPGDRAARLLDQVARDDEALDLVRALVDLRDLGVAHVLLDRVVLHVAVAAEDLHRVGGDLHGHVGREAACAIAAQLA